MSLSWICPIVLFEIIYYEYQWMLLVNLDITVLFSQINHYITLTMLTCIMSCQLLSPYILAQTFYFNPSNPDTCTECFCMGVTGDCRSTSRRRMYIRSAYSRANGWRIVESNNRETSIPSSGMFYCFSNFVII